MTDREQLLELREDLRRIRDGASIILSDADLELIDRLLARFPYEPEEWVEVSQAADREWVSRVFLVGHADGVWVRDEIRGCECATWWPRHRPIPRTITLEVPEEIARKAEEAIDDLKITSGRKAYDVCQWLAREAGK